jgi:hypothetical protein
MVRPNPIAPIYRDVDECKFDDNGKEHKLFYETGFERTELSAYTDSVLIGEIR